MITANLNYLIARSLNKSYEIKLIKKSEAKKLLKNEYSDALKCAKNNNFIYRGQWENSEGYPFISIPNYRISQNTNYNVYTRLFSDILPSWKDYPKRNHSFICSNNLNKADGYSNNLYIVFPKNGTKLGICPESDIWDSFAEHDTLNRFNNKFISLLEDIFDVLKISSIDLESLFIDGTKNEIKKMLTDVDKQLATFLSSDKFKEITHFNYLATKLSQLYNDESFDKKNVSLIKILDKWFNPKTNNFTLIDIKDYSSFKSYNNEIWFDNEALFLPEVLTDWVKNIPLGLKG